jgi:predicted metal-binding membrane protein
VVSATTTGIPRDTVARGERWAVALGVSAVSLFAWLWLAGAHGREGSGSVWGASSFVHTIAMWWAMTLAMMLPTSLPWFLVLARFGRTRATVAGFAVGYVSLWLGYGLVAAALQLSLRRGAVLGGNEALAAPLSGALLVGAGLFQLTPFKNACLDRCRNPLSYFLTHWNDGRWGSVAMGVRHGVDCLGCCWALMATAFALGVMNLLWMVALSVVAAVEKAAPRGPLLGRAFGLALVAWGIAVVAVA